MLKLRYKLLLNNTCSVCETLKNVCVSLRFWKSSLASSQGKDEHKDGLKKTICNYHHDALDTYTSILVMENMTKWETNNLSSSINISMKTKSNSILELCDDPDRLIIDLQRYLDGCCEATTRSALSRSMMTMARYGRIDGLELIESINAKYNYGIGKTELKMNFAEAHWVNGDLLGMFKIFETIYPTESMKINYVLDPIISTVVKSRGVASVVTVSKFVESIVANYGDHHPLGILWKYLFLSELFDDNLEAEKLMQQNGYLIDHVQYLIPIITKNVLKNHKVDCVLRLMTTLLKHNKMEYYQWILRSLFEYYCEYSVTYLHR